MRPFRIFLSAVSTEFEQVRTHAANDLVAKGLEVKVQENFRQEVDSTTTLELLHNYIRDCHAVVCVIGERSGAFPPNAAALPYAHILPAGISRASYTQWEYFFARHYKKRCSVYWSKGYTPERVALPNDDAGLQATYGHWLRDQGLNKNYFDSIDALCRQVNKEEWPIHARPTPQNLPYPSIGNLFVGRETFIRQLRESLTRHAHTAIKPRQAIHGLGGIGKTRLATEYAWQHAADYSALLFVIAETPEALRRNLAALCGPLVLNLPEQDLREEERKVAAALTWLRQHAGWYLLVDNVDTREAVAEAERLLGNLSSGHVVYTSRLSNWGASVKPLELDVLDRDVSARFILERTANKRRNQPDDEAQARAIATDVDGLALALEQVCAYVEAQRLSLADYRKRWCEQHDKLLEWYDPQVMHYPRSVAITWETSISQLDEDASQLFMCLSWLSAESVPERILDIRVAEDDKLLSHTALAALERYSLVKRNPSNSCFSVHRLVQDIGRRSQMKGSPPPGLIEALQWVNAAFVGEPSDVTSWPVLMPLLPHVEMVLQHADLLHIEEIPPSLLDRLGLLLKALDRLSEAEPWMRRAAAIDEAQLGSIHSDVAIRLSNLALLLKTAGRYAEAEELILRALAIDEKVFGTEHPNVAIRLNNLATLLIETNRFTEAEEHMRRVLSIDEAVYGLHHENVAVGLNNLAQLLLRTNRLAEAESLMRRGLRIEETHRGPHHPYVAIQLNNLAQLLQTNNRLHEAEPMLRRALAIHEKNYGTEHSNVAIALNNLAQLLRATNRQYEAEPVMRRALKIMLRMRGSSHPLARKLCDNYAVLLTLLGHSNSGVEAELKKIEEEASGNGNIEDHS